MRRLLAWLGGVLGGIAAYRLLRGREPVPVAEVDPRAEALRAKLDEVRAPDEAGGPVPADVVPEAQPASGEDVADPDARRRSVHEHGRAAVEEMRAGGREQ